MFGLVLASLRGSDILSKWIRLISRPFRSLPNQLAIGKLTTTSAGAFCARLGISRRAQKRTSAKPIAIIS